MRSLAITAVTLLLLAATPGFARDFPEGWRRPTSKELAPEPSRKDSPTQFAMVKADFNADGIEDEAVLLKSNKFSGEALWVWLSDGPNRFNWVKLAEIKWGREYPNVPLAQGIELAAPGVYAYGCFDDSAAECNFGPHKGRPKLRLRDPALIYFKFESAASMFFWSRKSERFLRVWLSD